MRKISKCQNGYVVTTESYEKYFRTFNEAQKFYEYSYEHSVKRNIAEEKRETRRKKIERIFA